MTTTAPIDWETVRRRLHESESSLERSFAPDEDRLAATLRRRAMQLASRATRVHAHTNLVPTLVGLVTGRPFGFALQELQEVTGALQVTPVVGAPAGVSGIVNLRGQLRCVVSIEQLLSLSGGLAEPAAPRLVFFRRHDICVVLDEIVDIQHLAPEEIRQPEHDDAGRSISRGVKPDGCTIVDVDKFVARLARSTGGTEVPVEFISPDPQLQTLPPIAA